MKLAARDRFPFTRSVKSRMIAILLLSSILPLALLGFVSYSSFHSFLQHTLTSGIQQNVDKELTGIDNILKNLNFASQQLALDGVMVKDIQRYMTSDDIFQKQESMKNIQDRMALINYSSPHVGIITILDGNRQMLFQNYPSNERIDLNRFPLLVEAKGVSYQAPHLSVDKYGSVTDPPVISVSRKVTDYQDRDLSFYVYIESNFQSMKQLFQMQQYGEVAAHLLLNDGNRVLYSENDALYAPGSVYPANGEGGKAAGGMRFIAASEQGWQLVVLLRGDAFKAEMTSWLVKFGTIGLFSLALGFLLAIIAWRTIYRPLQTFRREIEWMGDSRIIRPRRLMKLIEFDDLLGRFYRMRDRVFALLEEIEWRERARSRIEVEKLRYQINPHFIHNTLNTVQVIAKVHKQEEIVLLVTYFTRILHYNLGKEGVFVHVKDEINNLRDYLALQQIRYGHAFQVELDIDPAAEENTLPRFVLQPLVENALYHGFRNEDGVISVAIVRETDGGIRIDVSDNGIGMTEETVAALLQEQPSGEGRKSGMGIGLAFAHRLIRTYYGEQRGLSIHSRVGEGTRLTIQIPAQPLEGMEHDSDLAGR
ncbi:sensor histidine kinase [Paenibacillus sacheonensis]|uniref:histidine kinase n=1 Tax=Paenibacillus sacheonensis TaxID=742054 RepID=A0A7X4YST9_9BACL|nr:histidine kinase [Paenibacillus sacheonensis]MBM7567171.1 two-component system sensor histidine kinase YesM [Paenibacillus sacheonensis]NBC70904.1 hypothetical protein [Paenibacillus sacheonensis]